MSDLLDHLHFAYSVAWIPVCLAAALIGYVVRDRGLIRCSFIVLSAQFMTLLWVDAFMVDGRQPWGFLLAIYAASCIVATVRPTTRLCSMMGGINLGGVVISVVHGVFGGSDNLYWANNVYLGVTMLAILIGGAGREVGRVLHHAWQRRVDRLARTPGSGGLG